MYIYIVSLHMPTFKCIYKSSERCMFQAKFDYVNSHFLRDIRSVLHSTNTAQTGGNITIRCVILYRNCSEA